MPAYAYRAVDRSGRRLRGREEAASSAALGRALEAKGLLVLELAEAEEDTAGRARFAGFGFGRRRAVLEVTRALAALLPAGLPVARALAASGNVAPGPLAGVLDAVRARVERGASLAAALAEHPSYFSPLYVGVVRAGERSGDLAGAFRRLATQLEREEALRARLVSASLYPMLLGLVGGAAVLVLMLFVLPRFVELLEGAGAPLPRSTALLLASSDTLQRFWPVLLALFVGAIGAALAYGRTAAGRRVASHALLRLPVIGALRRQALAARFARLAGVLVGGGAPLLSALDDALESMADPVARDDVARVRARVREGVALNRAVAEGTLFPPLLAQLLAVGEESGRLEEFLLKSAEVFEERTGRAMERLVALAEPAMILGFGAAVAFVALSLVRAIYGVNAGAFR